MLLEFVCKWLLSIMSFIFISESVLEMFLCVIQTEISKNVTHELIMPLWFGSAEETIWKWLIPTQTKS